MPSRKVVERAEEARREGKSPSTQAGEFVREEIHHIREGKHGARSTEQAIAIGLSKARRAGVQLPAPPASERTRKAAARDLAAGRQPRHEVSRKRSRAVSAALKREGHAAASTTALVRQAQSSARRRGAAGRSAEARTRSNRRG